MKENGGNNIDGAVKYNRWTNGRVYELNRTATELKREIQHYLKNNKHETLLLKIETMDCKMHQWKHNNYLVCKQYSA